MQLLHQRHHPLWDLDFHRISTQHIKLAGKDCQGTVILNNYFAMHQIHLVWHQMIIHIVFWWIVLQVVADLVNRVGCGPRRSISRKSISFDWGSFRPRIYAVDQGDQFPRNPFHLIGVPVHSQGVKANATMCLMWL